MDLSQPHYIRGRDGVFVVALDEDRLRTLDVSLDGRNVDIIRRYLSAWTAVLADSPRICGRKPVRVFRKFVSHCLSQPLKTTIVTAANLADRMLLSAHIVDGGLTDLFIPEMLSMPIAHEYLTWRQTHDPEILRYILTFLWFGKKLRYDDPDLPATALAAWHLVEERLHSIQLPTALLQDLRKILAFLLPEEPDLRDEPRHGPKSVAEKSGVVTKHWKNSNVRFDEKLDRAFIQGGMKRARRDWSPPLNNVIPDVGLWEAGRLDRKKRTRRVSKLLFVPKTIKTARSICKEPCAFMYFQQEVLSGFQRAFRKGSLKRFVQLESQDRNKSLSGLGSLWGHLDTIDLSAASDSVSWQLVREIFPRQWLYYLTATRTPTVQLPTGELVHVEKFAPMGSAVCFPVQCTVFLAIVLLAYLRRDTGTTDDNTPCFSRRRMMSLLRRIDDFGIESAFDVLLYRPIAIYGDDIICDSRITSDVTHLLNTLGFEVNQSKSFTGQQAFRESCGAYWLEGFDVTPMLFRIKPGSLLGVTPKQLASVIAGANNAGSAGLHSLQLLYIRWALSAKMEPDVIESNRTSYGLPTPRPYNPGYAGDNPIRFTSVPDDSFSLVVRHPEQSSPIFKNWAYQKRVSLSWTLLGDKDSVSNLDEGSERYAYLRWWADLSPIDERKENIPRVIDRRSVTRVKIGWRSHEILPM